MTYFTYNLTLWLLTPFLIIKFIWRALFNKGYRNGISQRFGLLPKSDSTCEVWIHAVSVGEVNAAIPLIKKILELNPPIKIIVTTMTPTGMQLVKKNFGKEVCYSYMPYDYPFAIKRFLNIIRPNLLVLMETEIWPNTIRLCKKHGLSIVIANMRLSKNSTKKYQRIRPLVKETLENVSIFATQTHADSENLKTLGVDAKKIICTGSLKFEAHLPKNIKEKSKEVRHRWGINRLIILAGSTHEGEELLLLQSLKVLQPCFPKILLVIAPRHPERVEAVYKQAIKNGFKVIKRSIENKYISNDCHIEIVDTIGELPILYSASDVAVVGGSLLDIRGIGGHNILEPCAVGIPVIFGSNMGNFLEISKLTLANKAGYQVTSLEDLVFHLDLLLKDENLRSTVGNCGRMMIEKNTGAALKTMKILLPLISTV